MPTKKGEAFLTNEGLSHRSLVELAIDNFVKLKESRLLAISCMEALRLHFKLFTPRG
jgi:hypothetical protein